MFLASQGVVSGVLTIIEFFIGTVAIICLRPTLLGIFFYRLHRKKQLSVNLSREWFRGFRRELLGFILAASLTVSVFIVETTLRSAWVVRNTKVESTSCAFTNISYPDSSISAYIPSKYRIDRASISIANEMNCRQGIESLDFGSDDESTDKYFPTATSNVILAPNCRSMDKNNNSSVNNLPLTLEVESTFIDNRKILVTQFRSMAHIIPYNGNGLGISNSTELMENLSPLPECQEKKISSLSFSPERPWEIRDANGLNISRNILQSVCKGHDRSEKGSITLDNARHCFKEFDSIETKCLMRVAQENSITLYSSKVENVAAVLTFPDKTFFDRTSAYSCSDASIRIFYFLVSANAISSTEKIESLENDISNNHSVVLPVRFRVESGMCEPSISGPALGAQIFAAREEWGNRSASINNRRVRFQSYLISIARFEFPLEKLRIIRSSSDQSCRFKLVREATEIRMNITFGILLVSIITCSLIFVVSILFRIFIPSETWPISTLMERIHFSTSVTTRNYKNISVGDIHAGHNTARQSGDAHKLTENLGAQGEQYDDQPLLHISVSESRQKIERDDISIEEGRDGRPQRHYFLSLKHK